MLDTLTKTIKQDETVSTVRNSIEFALSKHLSDPNNKRRMTTGNVRLTLMSGIVTDEILNFYTSIVDDIVGDLEDNEFTVTHTLSRLDTRRSSPEKRLELNIEVSWAPQPNQYIYTNLSFGSPEDISAENFSWTDLLNSNEGGLSSIAFAVIQTTSSDYPSSGTTQDLIGTYAITNTEYDTFIEEDYGNTELKGFVREKLQDLLAADTERDWTLIDGPSVNQFTLRIRDTPTNRALFSESDTATSFLQIKALLPGQSYNSEHDEGLWLPLLEFTEQQVVVTESDLIEETVEPDPTFLYSTFAFADAIAFSAASWNWSNVLSDNSSAGYNRIAFAIVDASAGNYPGSSGWDVLGEYQVTQEDVDALVAENAGDTGIQRFVLSKLANVVNNEQSSREWTLTYSSGSPDSFNLQFPDTQEIRDYFTSPVGNFFQFKLMPPSEATYESNFSNGGLWIPFDTFTTD